MRQFKKSRIISAVIGFIIGLFLGGAMIVVDIGGNMDIDESILMLLGVLILFLVFNIIHIILHEAGHLVFGLMTGYQFLSFRIYSTIFYKKDGQLLRRKFSVKGTAGQCLMYPPVRGEDGRFPFVLYNLGGGISNLIFSLLFMIPGFFIPNIIIRTILFTFAAAGIIMANTNLIPMNISGLQNDGMNLKSILKDKGMQEAFYLLLKVNAEMSDGKLLTDYSPEEFMLPEGTDDTNMIAAVIRMNAYSQQLAFHNFEAAEKILISMEEKSAKQRPAVLNSIMAERLFFMVLKHNPVEEIASVYERSRLTFMIDKTNIGIQSIRYIYETFLSEDEKRDIMTLVLKKPPKKWKVCDRDKLYREFLRAAENFPNAGVAAMNVELVNYLRNRNQADSG
jgi:hypothetical protein